MQKNGQTPPPSLTTLPFSVTVPTAGLPPFTLSANVTLPSSGKSVMSEAVVEPLNVAEIRTLVVAVTALVPMVKLAAVWPAGTVTP